MPGPAFDPSGAVRFDLSSGSTSDPRGTRLVLLPAAALEALDRTTPGALSFLASELGRACGARVAANLGGDANVRGAELEVVVTHLAGELAIAGLGAVSVERWGKALVFVVSNPSVASDAFVSAALAGAVQAATNREVAVGVCGKDGTTTRYFVGSQATVMKIRGLVSQGKSAGDVLAAVQKVNA